MGGVKYSHITVKLTGKDGNAFAILGAVRKAMARGGCSREQVNDYLEEAMAGDYDHLLQVTTKTVKVE